MSLRNDLDASIRALGFALNRFYWEGNPDHQIYSLAGVLNLLISFPEGDSEARAYLVNSLREWNDKGYIKFNEQDTDRYVEVINPSFSFL